MEEHLMKLLATVTVLISLQDLCVEVNVLT